MTKYLLAALAILALAAVGYAGFQSLRLADVRADLATTQTELTAANTTIDRISRERAVVTRSLADERERIVAVERQAADLREAIARDAGTARDGETAPVLRDAIERLLKTAASRQDAFYNGRRPDVWQMIVIVDGKIERRGYTNTEKLCRQVAAVAALEIAARPELIADASRVRITCANVRPGERA